jgi:hypothetical protein
MEAVKPNAGRALHAILSTFVIRRRFVAEAYLRTRLGQANELVLDVARRTFRCSDDGYLCEPIIVTLHSLVDHEVQLPRLGEPQTPMNLCFQIEIGTQENSHGICRHAIPHFSSRRRLRDRFQ